jgi:hypothetical protein
MVVVALAAQRSHDLGSTAAGSSGTISIRIPLARLLRQRRSFLYRWSRTWRMNSPALSAPLGRDR